MSVISNNILAGASGQAGGAAAGYEIERSLRFNSGDSSHLSRIPSSAGNRKTWTWSGWVKRTDEGSFEPLFSAGNNPWVHIAFRNGKFDCILDAGVGNLGAFTDAIYRDQSAWYHLVLAVDTTQSTAADRIKFYVNGVEVDKTADIGGYPSQNYDTLVNSTIAHRIGADGRVTGGGIRHCDCYMADVHFIDGSTPGTATDDANGSVTGIPNAGYLTDFGEFDDNGVWQPKAYAGSYGTNGFKLNFSDNSSAATLGTDQSTNNNDWTVNNLVASVYTGTVQYGEDTGNSNFDSSATSLTYDTTGFSYSTVTSPKTDTGQANASTVLKTSDGTAIDWTFSTDTTDRYIWTSSNGINWSSPGTLYDTDGGPKTVNAAWVAWAGGSNVSVLTVTFADESTIDSLFDSPTNGVQTDTGLGGQVSGNYCTLNPLAKGAATSLSNGNLNYVGGAANQTLGTIGMSSGKWYWEDHKVSGTYGATGIALADAPLDNHPGQGNSWAYNKNGNKWHDGTQSSYGATWDSGDTIGVAFDADAGTLVFYKNGVSQGTAFTGLTNGPYFVTGADNSVTGYFNFGQRAFAYTAPSGFKALNTANLPDPTLADGSDYMDVVTYNGNGTSQTISGLEFSPDFVWIKERTDVGGLAHYLGDTVRGINKNLQSNATNTEVTDHPNGYISATTSDGFTVTAGSGNDFYTNGSTESYVAWTWDAGHPATATTGAVSFDGNGDYLSLPASSDFNFGSGDFTIEFFWYPTSTSRQALYHGSFGADYSIGIDYNSVGTNKLGFWASSDGTTWDIVNADGSGSGITTGEPIQNAWNHIAFVRNGNSLTMYLNGGSVGSITSTATISLADTDTPVIGAWWNSNTAMNDVHGSISNFRILKGTALYTSNFTPPTAELTNVTNTKLLCCQSTTSAGAAAVSPNLGGINDGTVWSDAVTGGRASNPASFIFDGSTTTYAQNTSPTTNPNTITITFNSISYSTSVEAYVQSADTSVGLNGGALSAISSSSWQTVTSGSGTLNQLVFSRASTSGCAVNAIRIDGTILKDPVTQNGDVAATTFNPLDAFSVNGTGYATASAAGITEGTIPLTGASVNQSAGFSIVSYTGTGAAGTVGHGLNAAPKIVIFKNRDAATNWRIYTTMVDGSMDSLFLNTTAAKTDSSLSAFTSNVFYCGTNPDHNGSGQAMTAYCFAPVEGYSAFGKYVGLASASEGTFVYTGFRPKLVIIKGNSNYDGGGTIVNGYNWYMYDSSRSPYNAADDLLGANKSFAEETAAAIDFLSNGFKIRNNNAPNAAIDQYYIAFAENPFKTARAR